MTALAETVPYRGPVYSSPRPLMADLGLVPGEYSSESSSAAAASPRPATPHARRALVEAASRDRHGLRSDAPCASEARDDRRPATRPWRAQQRLHRRDRRLVDHGKRPAMAVGAVARKLIGCLGPSSARFAVDVAPCGVTPSPSDPSAAPDRVCAMNNTHRSFQIS